MMLKLHSDRDSLESLFRNLLAMKCGYLYLQSAPTHETRRPHKITIDTTELVAGILDHEPTETQHYKLVRVDDHA